MFQFSGDVWQKDPNTEIACIFLSLISKLYKKTFKLHTANSYICIKSNNQTKSDVYSK